MRRGWFRVAAVLLVLFAVGHTIGFLTFRAATEEGRAVWEGMNRVHFSDGNGTYSYGEFYLGFGLFITVFQLFAAWVAWLMPSLKDARLGWAMALVQLISAALAARYFAWPPLVMSLLTAICLIVGTWKMSRGALHMATQPAV